MKQLDISVTDLRNQIAEIGEVISVHEDPTGNLEGIENLLSKINMVFEMDSDVVLKRMI